MKKTIIVALLALCAGTSHAGIYYGLDQSASSATLKLAGKITVSTPTASISTAPASITLDGGSGAVTATSFAGGGAGLTGVVITNQSSSYTNTSSGGILAFTSVTAGAFFGDGSHLLHVSTSTNGIGSLPAGTILSYFANPPPSGTVECDGLSYATTFYPVLYAAIGCAAGCADGSHFNVPDLRGVFLRGWNHGVTTTTYVGDPDAVSRSTIATGGSSGDNIGSYESSTFTSHYHTSNFVQTGGGFTGSNAAINGTASPQFDSNSAGGRETRPKNMYVLYAIKTDDNAQLSAGISLTGSTGTVVSQSSITASAFFGDGSHLTGLVTTLPSVAVTTAPNNFNSNSTNTFTAPSTFVGSMTTLGQVLHSGPTNSFTYGLATSTINATGQIFAGSFAGTAFSAIGTNSADINTLNGNVTLSPGGVVALTAAQTGKNIAIAYGLSVGSITVIGGSVTATNVGGGAVGLTVTSSLTATGGVAPKSVDLSTVTTALNLKLDITTFGAYTSSNTTALSTKLSSGAVPAGFVDFSTITTALALKLTDGGTATHSSITVSGAASFGAITASSMTLTGANWILLSNVVGATITYTAGLQISTSASAGTGTFFDANGQLRVQRGFELVSISTALIKAQRVAGAPFAVISSTLGSGTQIRLAYMILDTGQTLAAGGDGSPNLILGNMTNTLGNPFRFVFQFSSITVSGAPTNFNSSMNSGVIGVVASEFFVNGGTVTMTDYRQGFASAGISTVAGSAFLPSAHYWRGLGPNSLTLANWMQLSSGTLAINNTAPTASRLEVTMGSNDTENSTGTILSGTTGSALAQQHTAVLMQHRMDTALGVPQVVLWLKDSSDGASSSDLRDDAYLRVEASRTGGKFYKSVWDGYGQLGLGTLRPTAGLHISSGPGSPFGADGAYIPPSVSLRIDGDAKTPFQVGISSFIIGSTFTVIGSSAQIYGVLTSSTPSPTFSCNAGTPTPETTVTNTAGTFTAGSAAANCTVTFSQAWKTTPHCVVTDDTSLVPIRVSARSTTAITIAGTTISSDVISYFCWGAP